MKNFSQTHNSKVIFNYLGKYVIGVFTFILLNMKRCGFTFNKLCDI